MKKDFNYLVNTFKNSIKTWDYFVNWNKVFSHSSELEIILNKLNYLLGKKNLKEEFIKLYSSNPDIIRAIPALLAIREKNIELFDLETKKSMFFNFNNNANKKAEEYYDFIKNTGLAKLFNEDGIKNLVDYVIGVEVGLDSNGRKNREGTLMEDITEANIIKFCNDKGLAYLKQVNAKKIKEEWGLIVEVDKSSRSFDFAIYNPKNNKIKLLEVNFYNGGGSKLKAVCGEFKSLYTDLRKQNIDFIWITDGKGWETALRPLEETYNHNEYVFNLNMIENGILNDLIW